MNVYYGILACLILKTCTFINFILAHEEILHGNLISVVCTPPVTALNYVRQPVWKVGLNYLTSAGTQNSQSK